MACSWFQVYAFCFSAFSGLLFGYDLCVITLALDSIKEHFSLSVEEKEAVVSTLMGGAVVGALVGGSLADYCGRKRTIILSAACFTLGSVWLALAPTFIHLILGRIIVGIGVGCSGMVASVYMTELAPRRYRGILVSVNEVAVCTGCLVAIGMDILYAHAIQEDPWRWMLGTPAVFATIQFFGCFFLPSSPRWLIKNGKLALAKKILLRIHGAEKMEEELREMMEGDRSIGEGQTYQSTTFSDETIPTGEVELQGYPTESPLPAANPSESSSLLISNPSHNPVSENAGEQDEEGMGSPNLPRSPMPSPVPEERARCPAIKRLICTAKFRKPLVLAVLVALMQNLTFSNAMLYYSDELVRRTGISSPQLAVLGVGSAKFVGVLVSLILVGKMGRRTLLLLGTTAEIVFLLAMAISSFTLEGTANQVAVLTGLCGFIFAWDISWAPLMWVVCNELLPQEIRGIGMGMSLAMFWGSGTLSNQFLLTLIEGISFGGALMIAALSGVIVLVFVALFVPETKGLSLEDIQKLWTKGYFRSCGRQGCSISCYGLRLGKTEDSALTGVALK